MPASLLDEIAHLMRQALQVDDIGLGGDYFAAIERAVQIVSGRDGNRVSILLLSLLCCQAAGGDPRLALPVAAAWALLHAAAQVLDDVEDGEPAPRLGPDIPPLRAISVATGLALAAPLSLAQNQTLSPEQSLALIVDFQRAALRIAAGQHADLTESEVSLSRCWQMIEAKSGAAFALACRAGAELGGANRARIAHYSRFGRNLGVLIQISDDSRDLWQPETGRSDLAAGKRTLPVVYALSVAPPPVKGALLRKLAAAPTSTAAEREARAMITELGAPLYLLASAQKWRQEAERSLAAAAPLPPAGRFLRAMLQTILPPPLP